MKKERGKKIVFESQNLGAFPDEIHGFVTDGVDKYLDEIKRQKTKAKKLDATLKILKEQSDKLGFRITKDFIDSYLNDLLLRS